MGRGQRPATLLSGRGGRVWCEASALLAGGFIPPELHDSLLYAAARLSPKTGAQGPAVEASAAPGSSSAPGGGREGVRVVNPASVLAPAAAAATRGQLHEYGGGQLAMVFSALASMRVELPKDWLELFWEFSRPHVSFFSVAKLRRWSSRAPALPCSPAHQRPGIPFALPCPFRS